MLKVCWNPLRSTKILLNTFTLSEIWTEIKKYIKLCRKLKGLRDWYISTKLALTELFRVNSSGEFNSPFGHYKNPNIVNEPILRAVSKYFGASNITFYSEDFAETLKRVRKGGFVYLDPPYDPVSDTASFTGYNKGGFDRNEQIRLKQCCDELTRRGVKFMLSNSATEFIKELYGEYEITIVKSETSN